MRGPRVLQHSASLRKQPKRSNHSAKRTAGSIRGHHVKLCGESGLIGHFVVRSSYLLLKRSLCVPEAFGIVVMHRIWGDCSNSGKNPSFELSPRNDNGTRYTLCDLAHPLLYSRSPLLRAVFIVIAVKDNKDARTFVLYESDLHKSVNRLSPPKVRLVPPLRTANLQGIRISLLD